MCLDRLRKQRWRTRLGTISGDTIANLLKILLRIIKSILSRCLYTFFTFLAVWRVTVALREPQYWLLLFVLCPLVLEMLHTILVRRGNEMKWVTPSVFFYLLGGIPCIWLLEIKLLNDRLSTLTDSSEETATTNATAIQDMSLGINIDLSDEGWTLALEQILIFVLVFGKWIAPKGELSRDELSQLLLVNIAAGADIIELLEVFGEDKVSQNREIVFLVMAVWSWSLLQFCLVLTATKELPSIDDDDEPITHADVQNGRTSDHTNEGKQSNGETTKPKSKVAPEKDTLMLPGIRRKERHLDETLPLADSRPALSKSRKENSVDQNRSEQDEHNGSDASSKRDRDLEVGDESHFSGTNPVRGKVHDNLRADEEVEKTLQGRYCFDCFCCYTEIWGMVMSICFQDGPFLITRLFIMLHYGVVTHMNVFFTCKNVLVILLLLNRIRVIVLEQRKTWKTYMLEYKKQTDAEANERRRKLGLPPKKRKDTNKKTEVDGLTRRKSVSRPETAEPIPKPKWVIWRA